MRASSTSGLGARDGSSLEGCLRGGIVDTVVAVRNKEVSQTGGNYGIQKKS
jgi:hypothetical protein